MRQRSPKYRIRLVQKAQQLSGNSDSNWKCEAVIQSSINTLTLDVNLSFKGSIQVFQFRGQEWPQGNSAVAAPGENSPACCCSYDNKEFAIV